MLRLRRKNNDNSNRQKRDRLEKAFTTVPHEVKAEKNNKML